MRKISSLLLVGIAPWIFANCTVNPRMDKTKYWPCEKDTDCGGDCECFDGKICVHADPNQADESCAPCQAPDADCDNNPATGCETDLDSDNENCGSCANACLDYQTCEQGKCIGCDDADKDDYKDASCGGDDCDDSNPDVHPGADEICGNAIDEDCNGVDRPCGCEKEDDQDKDGYYSAASCGGSDCDDDDKNINPDQPETICDGKDNDCDPSTKDVPDTDGDGFDACEPGDPGDDGNQADCDDDDENIYPGAEEITCNGWDENCNGMNDDAPDEDKDGYDICAAEARGDTDGLAADCDDEEQSINPGLPEIICNGQNDDCDPATPDIAEEKCGNIADEDCSGGINDPDADGDGFIASIDSFGHPCGGTDCDDDNADVNPNASEIPCNNADENCNGPQDDNPDFDVDGYTFCGIAGEDIDCDDMDPNVHPGQHENTAQGVANYEPCSDCKDNDCDGKVDCADEDCAVDGDTCFLCTDLDSDGWPYCVDTPGYACNDCAQSNPEINPGADEVCGNPIDENCDGPINFIDHDGDGYPAGQDALGNSCGISDSDIDCDDQDYNVHPDAIERCDGQDDNCDTEVDNLDEDEDGHYPCFGQDCNDLDGNIYVGAVEDCFDNMDNDCDGLVDCADPYCDGQCNDCLDDDGDGWAACSDNPDGPDCDDSDPRIHPGQIPLCNDNNSCGAIELQINWLAGSGDSGSNDGNAQMASFNGPGALSLGYNIFGNPLIYVADKNNNSIRRIDLASSQGGQYVETLAGNPDNSNDEFVSQGTIEEVSLNSPSGLLWVPGQNGDGALIFADSGNNAIRIVSLDLDPYYSPYYIMTIAGNGDSGHEDGFLTQATFNNPHGITMDDFGNLYVADTDNHCIRKISSSGWVSTFSGKCTESGDQDGIASQARFHRPSDIEYLGAGRFLVTDMGNNKIRALNADGMVLTLIGDAGDGNQDGYHDDAKIHNPTDMLIDWIDGVIIFADTGNSRIRLMQAVDAMDDIWTGTLAGGGETDISTWTSFGTCEVALSHPAGLAMYADPLDVYARTLYVSDSDNNMIYSIPLF